MHNKIKMLVAIMLTLISLESTPAKAFQPSIIMADPDLYVDEYYTGADTVPARRLVKTTIVKPTTVRQAQPTNTELKPATLQPATVQTPTTTVKQTNVRPTTTTLQPTPTNVRPVIIRPAETFQPTQNLPAKPVDEAVIKKDTALIRRLTETFKFKRTVTAVEKKRITLIIDSVYKSSTDHSKANAGDSAVSYQELVRIIDSLLKANKNDSQKVVVDTPLVKPAVVPIINTDDTNDKNSLLQNYWWLFVLIAAGLAGLVFFLLKRKKATETGKPKIFFSYAWDQDEALIMQLYNSLKRDGFNVIKDKENIGYKGVISKFMNEIGSADFVIVAISDKYLKSKFCMYELYEIFRNSGMDKDCFGKKIFPIRIDETLDLSNPDVVNGYARYWKQQEQEWTTRVREESDSITEEQARQFQFIKRLVNDVHNILSCMADINSLNLSTLKGNDFADVKSALRQSMEV